MTGNYIRVYAKSKDDLGNKKSKIKINKQVSIVKIQASRNPKSNIEIRNKYQNKKYEI